MGPGFLFKASSVFTKLMFLTGKAYFVVFLRVCVCASFFRKYKNTGFIN